MSSDQGLIEALEPVAKAFQALGVAFYVGGSVASSFHGAGFLVGTTPTGPFSGGTLCLDQPVAITPIWLLTQRLQLITDVVLKP